MTDQAARVRSAFPHCAAVADSFRAAFGASVRMTYAQENGNQAGRALDESSYTVIAGADLIVAKPQKGEKRDR